MFKTEKTIQIFLFTIFCIVNSVVFANNLENGIYFYNQKRFNDAYPIIEKEARKGNSEAQYYLGKMYDFGQGKTKNISKAFYWYSKGPKQSRLYVFSWRRRKKE